MNDNLTARRAEAARRVATLTFDLGGLTAAMADAGQFRLDVLVRQATELRAAEAALADLDRQLAAPAPAGLCRHCATPHAPGADFCSRCGRPLAAAS